MTQTAAIKWAKEIKALFDGKQIQEIINGKWVDSNDPSFDLYSNYRIKPELKLVPFDFTDAEKLIGKVVKSKDTNQFYVITAVLKNKLVSGCYDFSFEYALDVLIFLDGSLCGKEVQE
jgi:hypothetical protein